MRQNTSVCSSTSFTLLQFVNFFIVMPCSQAVESPEVFCFIKQDLEKEPFHLGTWEVLKSDFVEMSVD